MPSPLPALNLIATPGWRRATLEMAREIERRGFAGISVSSSFANMALAWAFYAHGGWRKARMAAQPSEEECIEESEASMEPGGRLRPAG